MSFSENRLQPFASNQTQRVVRQLASTEGYWHFKSHKDLLRELLQSWEQTNTGPFERAPTENGAPKARIRTAISSAFSLRAKWLASSTWTSAPGTSR
jgi:hypothetical protein